jgi:hypothetical protein
VSAYPTATRRVRGGYSLSASQAPSSREITDVFWALPLLKELLNAKQLEHYWMSKHRGHSIRDDLAQGYAFLITCLLCYLAKAIIRYPYVLDFDHDELLERAYQANVPLEDMPARTPCGRLVNKTVTMYRSLMGSRNFKDIETKAHLILNGLVKPLNEAFESTVTVLGSDSKTELSPEEALRGIAIFDIPFRLDLSSAKIAYNSTFNKRKAMFAQWVNIPERMGSQRFFDGYKFAILYLLEGIYRVAPDSSQRIRRVRTWSKFELDTIRSAVTTPSGVRRHGSDFATPDLFRKPVKMPNKVLNQLTLCESGKDRRPLTPERRLDEAFMWTRIIVAGTNETATSATGFAITLMGMAKLRRGLIRVLKLIHRRGSGNNYSFAILVEAYTNLGDYSYWYVFPSFATDYSGTGGSGYDFVTDQIKKLGKRIRLQEVHIGESEFYRYLKRTKESELESEVSKLSQALEAGHGAILELMYGLIALARGDTVRWRYRNSKILGDFEIDVLAVKFGQTQTTIEIAECSRVASQNDLARLEKKIELVRRDPARLLRSINTETVPFGAIEVTGCIVSALPPRYIVQGINMIYPPELEKLCSVSGLYWYEIRRLLGLPTKSRKTLELTPDTLLRMLAPEDFQRVV